MATETRPDSLQDQISEEIRVVLARRRMTRRELARLIGWSESGLSRKLGGQAGLTVDDLEKVANVLELSVTDLLPRPGEGVIIRREWFTRRSLGLAA